MVADTCFQVLRLFVAFPLVGKADAPHQTLVFIVETNVARATMDYGFSTRTKSMMADRDKLNQEARRKRGQK